MINKFNFSKIGYSTLIKGSVVSQKIMESNKKFMITSVCKYSELFLHTTEGEKTLRLKTFNLIYQSNKGKVEVVCGTKPMHALKAFLAFKNYPVDIEDFETLLEIEGVIDYKAIDEAISIAKDITQE